MTVSVVSVVLVSCRVVVVSVVLAVASVALPLACPPVAMIVRPIKSLDVHPAPVTVMLELEPVVDVPLAEPLARSLVCLY